MNLERIRSIVDAALYEGYILYPYRAGATKNRQRWTFGGIYPQAWFEATDGADPYHMQTQCLLEGDADTRLEIRVRFLHPLARQAGALAQPLDAWPAGREPEFTPVPVLEVGEQQFHSWQEAMERELIVADCTLGELLEQTRSTPFRFEGRREVEPVEDANTRIAGVLVRQQEAIRGQVDLGLDVVADHVWRLTVRIENRTAMVPSEIANREQASLYSFASTHTILGIEHGAFVSLMDPPDALKAAAEACDNQGAWPVLAGRPGTRDTVLSSPIILYDHPQVAPESPGDLYDATEVDEILSLNILAMTDDEKRQMADTDPRAAALLQRTESLSSDDFMRMHGVLRNPHPAPGDHDRRSEGPRLVCYRNGSTQLQVGDHVRLHPRAGGDVMDMALDGKDAVIEGIERDFEDRVHVAVCLDDDPGREWGLQRMPGHRFFFSVEEVEPLSDPRPAAAHPEARA